MDVPDVNVLVAASREDAMGHAEAKAWLTSTIMGHSDLGLSDAVASGFVRVVTHNRIFKTPTPLEVALAFVDDLWASGALSVKPGRRFWETFAVLCRASQARGSLVSDAAHAALVIDAGATWITFDRDFARFPGLSWRAPSG